MALAPQKSGAGLLARRGLAGLASTGQIAVAPCQDDRRRNWPNLVDSAALRLLGQAAQFVQFAHVQARDKPREIHVGGQVGELPSHQAATIHSTGRVSNTSRRSRSRLLLLIS